MVTRPEELTVPALVWPGVSEYVMAPLEGVLAESDTLTEKGALP
jgi:hypothetical protein